MSTNPSLEHQKLVYALLNHFKTQLGYQILEARYSGFSEPQKHGRHAPDIVAKDGRGVLHLAEAKIGDDLYSQITKEQFLDFSNRVMTNTNIPVPFHIIVYKEDEQLLRFKLNEFGLGYLIGNRIKIWTL
jgi:hypothetical protein